MCLLRCPIIFIYNRYSEIAYYNFTTTKSCCGKTNGHFAQVVWRDTKSVGVGIASMSARGLGKAFGYAETFIVAMYSPGATYNEGDKKEAYLANVKPRKRPCTGFQCKYASKGVCTFPVSQY